jgi:hypothetical protein
VICGLFLQVQYHLECLVTQGYVSDAQIDMGFCAQLLPKRTPEPVALGAFALLLAAKQRVPNLEAAFLRYRKPLLQHFQGGHDIERCTSVT